jgi:mycofactocin system glycosyltransferase
MVGSITKLLAYRLRRSVAYSQRDRVPVLVLAFPLKVLRLDPFWTPVLDSLSWDQFVPAEDLGSLVPSISPEKLVFFLDDLVRKGVLEPEGTFPLPDYPRVSVIVPVRNRPEEIAACLTSLTRIDYPPEKLEILVVDDFSSDSTPEVISTFPVALWRLTEHKQASFCRNLAARKAEGEILAFIDSDCQAHPLWLKDLVPAFKDSALEAIGGMVASTSGEKGLDRYEEVKSSLNIGIWFKRSQETDRFFYLPSCNLLVKRDVFLSLKGFREDLQVGEDVDFCWRLLDEGGQMEYRPRGKIYHRHRNRLSPFCRRRFEYGTSEPWLQRRHSHRIKQLILPPAGFLFWILLSLALFFLYPPLLVGSGLVLLLDSGTRFFKLARQQLYLTFFNILAAVLRSYLALLYHWAAFFSRYYLVLALPFGFFLPTISLTLIGLHLLTAGVEYYSKKPGLNFFSFLWYFTLDQLSYQLGVWWGCLKNRCFRPVNPLVATGPFFGEG